MGLVTEHINTDMFGSHWSGGYHAFWNSSRACQSSGVHTEYSVHNGSEWRSWCMLGMLGEVLVGSHRSLFFYSASGNAI